MDHETTGSWLFSLFASLVLIIVSIAGLGLVLFFAIDSSCVYQADEWLKVYPQAQQTELTYGFLRPYGTGITRASYTTDAPPALVRRWYTLATRQAEYAPIWRQLVLTAWWVEAGPNGNSTIRTQTSCGS